MTAEEAAMIMMSGSGGGNGQTVCELLDAKIPLSTVKLFGDWSVKLWQDESIYTSLTTGIYTNQKTTQYGITYYVDTAYIMTCFAVGICKGDELLFVDGTSGYYSVYYQNKKDENGDLAYFERYERERTRINEPTVEYNENYVSVEWTIFMEYKDYNSQNQDQNPNYWTGEENTSAGWNIYRDNISYRYTSITDWKKLKEIRQTWQDEYDAYYESIST